MAKQAVLQLETVRHKLEVERAKQEDYMKMEREGIAIYFDIPVIMYDHVNMLQLCSRNVHVYWFNTLLVLILCFVGA